MEVLKKMKNNEIKPNDLSTEAKASMKTRIISAIVGSALAVPLILLGDFFTFAAVGFVLIVSTYEIIHCAKKKYNPALYIVAFILALLMCYWPIIKSIPGYISGEDMNETWRVYDAYKDLYISIPILALSAFGLLTMVLVDKGFTVRDACFMFTMILLITVGYQSILYLRYLPSQIYHAQPGVGRGSYFNLYDNLESALLLIYVFVGTFMTDAGAYFIGIFFGKHKMLERVSPKKTWEGFFGGLAFSIVASFGFGFGFALGGHPLVYGILDADHWYLILILSLIIPLAATLGDFVFSSCKRYFGIKDFGNIIPGHGGMLDRLDSVVFTMIVTAATLSTFIYWIGA